MAQDERSDIGTDEDMSEEAGFRRVHRFRRFFQSG
jgi:hypothetical protein